MRNVTLLTIACCVLLAGLALLLLPSGGEGSGGPSPGAAPRLGIPEGPGTVPARIAPDGDLAPLGSDAGRHDEDAATEERLVERPRESAVPAERTEEALEELPAEPQPAVHVLTGRVHLTAGNGPERTRVLLRRGELTLAGGRPDEQGRFRLEVPAASIGSRDRLLLEADHPSHARHHELHHASRLLGPPGEGGGSSAHVEVVLQPPAALVRARVRAAAEGEVHGALFAVGPDGWPRERPADSCTTGDGRVVLRAPHGGSYWLVLDAEEHTTVALPVDARHGREVRVEDVELASEVALRGRLRVPREYRTEAIVLVATPALAPSRALAWRGIVTTGERFFPGRRTTRTDETGGFELRGLDELPVALSAEGLSGLGLGAATHVASLLPTPAESLVPLPVTRLDFQVSGPEGPIAGARLELVLDGDRGRRLTDDEGRAHVFVASEAQGRLLAEADGFLATGIPLSSHRPGDAVARSLQLVPAEAGAGAQLELDLSALDPVPGSLRVAVFPLGAELGHERLVETADGAARVEDLPEGEVQVVVADGDPRSFLLPHRVDAHLARGRATRLVVEMAPGGRVRLDAASAGLGAGERRVLWVSGPATLVPVDRDGRPLREVLDLVPRGGLQRIELFAGARWETFPNLAPGPARFELALDRPELASATTVEVGPGTVRGLDLPAEQP